MYKLLSLNLVTIITELSSTVKKGCNGLHVWRNHTAHGCYLHLPTNIIEEWYHKWFANDSSNDIREGTLHVGSHSHTLISASISHAFAHTRKIAIGALKIHNYRRGMEYHRGHITERIWQTQTSKNLLLFLIFFFIFRNTSHKLFAFFWVL